MTFFIFMGLFIFQRLSELAISRRNEKWLIANGAVEYGKGHYPVIVALHTLFIISLLVEYLISPHPANLILLCIFGVLLGLKAWVIASLGTYWNTKIWRVPNVAPQRKGLYKVFRHPNYMIVIAEILIIPLIFKLYFTAILFSFLNAVVLTIRIREENRVWSKA